jgi:hypothetical protein
VRLKSIATGAGSTIRLPDAPTVSCRFGERFSSWLRDLVGPIVAGALSKPLKSVRTGPGYECRYMNRAASGKLSAHSTGLAIDVSAIEVGDGWISVKPNGDQRSTAAIDAFRRAGCGWFTTVLGPGSDAAHADHIHVDILPHGSSDRYRICE